ncbi:thioredoxin [Mesorhizobium sp. SP-1A]|uniref:thioredoxin n=1 Tax=Mesorhizobium sp. SP-1A TaxID=3077840 RepID=UPI0028F6E8E1|nr:thioredoxin [Mesorhizobium sp. SP-1A]
MKKVDVAAFDEAIANADVAIIDFYADWCGPCKQMEPALQQIDSEATAEVIKVDIDQNPELAVRFGIKSIPTLLLAKDGDIIDVKVGTQSVNSLRNWIESRP